MSAQDLIVNLQKLDIELWVENEKLRYSAPAGVMTDEHLQQLVENKKDVVEWLQRAAYLQRVTLEPIETVSREQRQLASFAQQRMLFVENLIPETDSYNVSFPLRIVGQLDETALQKSFNSIIDRHESLRTRFENRGGDYLQIIEASLEMPVTRLSLGDAKKKNAAKS